MELLAKKNNTVDIRNVVKNKREPLKPKTELFGDSLFYSLYEVSFIFQCLESNQGLDTC